MAILMLNLLIAVLSTVHDSVNENAEMEFHLARNKFVQNSSSAVTDGRLPPPFNLLVALTGLVVDVFGTICDELVYPSLRWFKNKFPCCRRLEGERRASTIRRGQGQHRDNASVAMATEGAEEPGRQT